MNDTSSSKPSKSSARRTMTTVRLSSGVVAILLGFGCFALTNLFDGGFGRGFFQGGTIALMVGGAYLIGAGMWKARSSGEVDDGAHWLPSRDGAATSANERPGS